MPGVNGDRGESDERLEADLAAVAERRDRAALGRLFAHYGPRLKAFGLALGRDDAGAEALMQEVMLAIWQRADRFDRRRAVVSAWVYALARDVADGTVERGFRLESSSSDPASVDGSYKPSGSAPAVGPAAVLLTARQAVARMPEEELELLRTFYRVGRVGTGSDELGPAAAPVPPRLRPVLERLRRLLGGTGG